MQRTAEDEERTFFSEGGKERVRDLARERDEEYQAHLEGLRRRTSPLRMKLSGADRGPER